MKKTVSRLALVAGASVLATSAIAADLGGNCCADLEERIAELEATTARKGNRVMSLTVYGQVNRAILWHNDETSRVPHMSFRDNDGRSGTRFGFRGSSKLNEDITVRFLLELAVNDDAVSNLSQSAIRQSVVAVRSARLGEIALGRTSTATDGLAEIALGSYYTPFGTEEASQVSNVALAVGNYIDSIDGARRQGIHYVSPTMMGFSFAASYFHNANANEFDDNDRDGWDVALRYAGEFNGVRVAAGIGYREVETNTINSTTGVVTRNPDEQTLIFAGSVLHVPSGLFFNGGYARVWDGSRVDVPIAANTAVGLGPSTFAIVDYDAWNVGAGIVRTFHPIGATTLAADFGKVHIDGGAEPFYYGIGMVQNIDATATDVYMSWRRYDLDGVSVTGSVPTGPALEDTADVFTMGMRVRF
ncbi:MAG: porin [Hyphomicrobiaceae bacterium]